VPLIPEPERIHRVNRWPLLLILLGLGGCLQSHTLSSVPGEQETRISSTKPVPVDAPRPWQSYYHQVQADVAESMDNPYLALDEVEKALKYRPESIDLTLMKARLEEQIGQYGSALRTLNELTQAHPGRLKPWMELARVKRQLALSATDKSERVRLLKEIIPIYLDRVIAIDPLKEDAYVALFDLYSRTGQIQEGLKKLADGIKRDPTSTYLPFYLGFEYTRLHQYDNARTYFSLSIQRNPAFEPGWESLADLDAQDGKWKDAEARYRHILNHIQPGNPEVEAKLLKVYLAENKINDAISFLGEIIEEHPGNDRFRLILSSLLVEQNRFGPAIDEIQAIIRKNPGNLRLLAFLGSVYERSLHFNRAISTYQLMIRKFPGSYQGYFSMGDLYRKLGNPQKAVFYLRKAHRLAPGKWQIDFSLALTLEDWKKYRPAMAALHQAMVLKPGNSLLVFNRAVLLDQWNHRKYLSRVRADLKEAIRLDPRFPDALNYLGYTDVVENGNLVNARYLILRALTFDPQNPSYRDSLGWCYFKMGDMKRAFREESMALVEMPKDATVLSHMGQIEWSLSTRLAKGHADPKLIQMLQSSGLSGPDAATRLRERARIHLRESALIHPMKSRRVRLYLRLFGNQDRAFKKDLRLARIEWAHMHPRHGKRASLYRVQDGDTLQIISAKSRIYGSPQFWQTILKANRSVIHDPNHLPVGLILRIPPLPHREHARRQSGAMGSLSLYRLS
jgi:tetratricopeptide (TPR) repeat protein